MANSRLTPSILANYACAIGMDLGFNAAEVTQFCDREDFHFRTRIVFGDHKILRLPSPRPETWALAYDTDCPCIRASVAVEMPDSMLFLSSKEISDYLTSQLLELIPSGPTGVKTSLELE